MLVPVRCFTCGKVLADKWTAYVWMLQIDDAAAKASQKGTRAAASPRRRRKMRGGFGEGFDDADSASSTTAAGGAAGAPTAYGSLNTQPRGQKTAAGRVLDDLGITKYCCRTVMMSVVDLSLVI